MTTQTTETDILAHYGVKGMKWGKRKADAVRSGLAKNRAKKDAQDLTYYEGRNLKKGMDSATAKAEAQRKVERNAKVRKVVAVSAAVGVTAVAAYMVHKKIDRDFKSVTLSLDTPLKNINPEGSGRNLDRHLYVTYKNGDTNKYRGLLAKQYKRNAKLVKANPEIAFLNGMDPKKFKDNVYETTLGLKTEVRAPSNRQAKKIYKDLAKSDPSVAENLLPIMGKKSYREFNKSLVDDMNKDARDKFFDAVSKKGYNAILDTNDQWDSGFNTKRPIILLDAGKVAAEKHTRELLTPEINKHAKTETGKIIARAAGATAAKAGVIAAVTKKVNNIDRRDAQKSFVTRYRENNPNTNLSDAEIIARMP